MISTETPYKLAEIIRDTWPQIYYSQINKSELKNTNMIEQRVTSKDKKTFQFKYEYKPGLNRYFTIDLDKKYKIVSDSKKISGATLETLEFIYKKTDDIETATPIGVKVKFMRTNQEGTYYDLHELVEVE